MRQFQSVTRKGGVRGTDVHGQGSFGAGRGSRTHQGVDFTARAGEEILSPLDGNLVRIARPYLDDPNFEGVVITGTGAWLGIEVKLFYVVGHRSGPVWAGEVVGRAQDLRLKYPGITNHVHLEVREGGRVLNPNEMYWQCL